MANIYKVLNDLDLKDVTDQDQEFSLDVLIGLSETPKRLSSRYFYDDHGSELFQKIMDLPEYYLTQCEFDVLKRHKSKIAGLLKDDSFNLVELGAGDGRKTSILLDCFLEREFEFTYIPIDISEGVMKQLMVNLNRQFPRLKSDGIVAEYFAGLGVELFLNDGSPLPKASNRHGHYESITGGPTFMSSLLRLSQNM